MPQVLTEDKPHPEKREYYILNGQKRELFVFNNEWVQNNCNLIKKIAW